MSLTNEEGCPGHIHVSQVLIGYERANVQGPFLSDLLGIPAEAILEERFFPNQEEAETYASSLITPTDAPDAISIASIRVELN